MRPDYHAWWTGWRRECASLRDAHARVVAVARARQDPGAAARYLAQAAELRGILARMLRAGRLRAAGKRGWELIWRIT